MTSPQLEYDPEAHAYRLGSRIIPSVTQVLQVMQTFSYSQGFAAKMSSELYERAREFGTHVHAATDLHDRGVLDEASLDENLKPYLNAWKAFLRDTKFQVTHSEARVFHPLMKYAGTLDRRGVWKGTTWTLDIKTGGVPKTVGPQTAAYSQACDYPSKRRMCVQLSEGKYKIHLLQRETDFSLFTSCLNIWNHFYASERPVTADA